MWREMGTEQMVRSPIEQIEVVLYPADSLLISYEFHPKTKTLRQAYTIAADLRLFRRNYIVGKLRWTYNLSNLTIRKRLDDDLTICKIMLKQTIVHHQSVL